MFSTKKKVTAAITLGLASAFLLSACSMGSGSTTESSEPTAPETSESTPMEMDPAAKRSVHQSGRREQIGVAVALDHALREAGDERALREDAAGHALEADFRFACREADLPRLADQGIAVQHREIEGLARLALGVAIDGHLHAVRPGRGHDILGGNGRGEGGKTEAEGAGQHPQGLTTR